VSDPADQPSGHATHRRLERVADWLLPEENPDRAIYGAILLGALLAAESGLHDTLLEAFASALIAIGVVWLAHSYASLLASRLDRRSPLTAAALARALKHEFALVRGAAIPLFALVLAWVLGASQHVAVTAALWSAVATVVLLEIVAGTRMRTTRGELVIEVGVGVTLGAGIVALKVLVH